MTTATSVADMLRYISPALATAAEPSETALSDPDWVYEMKWDGIRAMVFVEPGSVTILNRRLRDITFRYPDVAAAFAGSRISYVLDGELIAFGPDGQPSFALAAQRDSVTKAASIAAKVAAIPATFMAFDCLYHHDRDLRGETLYTRRAMLEAITPDHPVVQVSPASEGNGTALWQLALDMGLEGVIAKDGRSSYKGRRTRSWLKYKRKTTLSCIAISYEYGEGARKDTVGALNLVLFGEDGSLVDVGAVGTGFTASALADAKKLLDAGQPFVAEIECLSIGTGGRLRHPVYKGPRHDLTAADCTVSQLAGIPRT